MRNTCLRANGWLAVMVILLGVLPVKGQAQKVTAQKSTAGPIVRVLTTERLDVPSGDFRVATVLNEGATVLLTTSSTTGLWKYDVQKKTLEQVSDAVEAGYQPEVSEEGQFVTVRERVEGSDKMARTARVRYALTDEARQAQTGKRRVMQAPQRSVKSEMQQMINQLAPNGADKSYIWASLSPNGKKICYYVCGNGCWVANREGSEKQYIAHDCRAAQWLNDEVIVGMADRDNGETIVSSQIVVYDLQGRMQTISDPRLIAMYPQVSGQRVLFSTEKGEVYVITLK